MKKIFNKNERGFSLIEVMISLVISGIIVIFTAQTLSQLMKFTQKTQVRSDVNQSMAYAVEIVKRSLRQAEFDYIDKDYTSASVNNVCRDEGTVTLGGNDSGGCASIQIPGGFEPVILFRDQNLFYTDASGDTLQISPDTVIIKELTLTRTDFTNINTAYIGIEMKVEDAGGILRAYGAEDDELVTVKTGVFLRRAGI